MSVFDTLELRFSANLEGVNAQLNGFIAQLDGLADAAGDSERRMEKIGHDMTKGLANGYGTGMSAVAEKIRASGVQMCDWLSQAVIAADFGAQGTQAAKLFAQGANGGVSAAKRAGTALTDGFAVGIRSGQGAVGSAVASIVNSATRKIRTMLSIHSPSKVTEQFGAYFGAGFAEGVRGSTKNVEAAADGLSATALSGLHINAVPRMESAQATTQNVAAAVQNALGNVQLNVPLYVDGMKLGEASIKGINAVTRATGRILLDI